MSELLQVLPHPVAVAVYNYDFTTAREILKAWEFKDADQERQCWSTFKELQAAHERKMADLKLLFEQRPNPFHPRVRTIGDEQRKIA